LGNDDERKLLKWFGRVQRKPVRRVHHMGSHCKYSWELGFWSTQWPPCDWWWSCFDNL